jgi:Zn-finger nucleic acid-binding protein
MLPEALNCPNCGAAVASDRVQCEFCKSRLKTVACPSCLGVMFLGSEFCGRCGERAVKAEILTEDNPGNCPRCKTDLQALKIGETSVRECLSCSGFWASAKAFETLCADKEQQSAVINYAGSKSHDSRSLAAISYVPCPDCKQLMNRSNFARSSGVIIDLCKEHGVWFDSDELPKIIEFIDKGGLTRSREKEKIELQDERARLRDEQHRLAMTESRSGIGRYKEDDSDSGFGRVISALFDL